MNSIFGTISLIIIGFVSFAQGIKDSDTIIYPYNNDSTLEIPAKFPGGEKALTAFLSKNLKWPAPYWCGEGKVYIQFIVDKDGTIKTPSILRGIAGSNKEVFRIIKLMPRWIPAYQLSVNENIASKVIFVINFNLKP